MKLTPELPTFGKTILILKTMPYNSSFTSQEVEQRLLQGYYDDIVEAGIQGGVLQEGEMTKQQLDLELAKRLKSPASQNGRMLLGRITKSASDDIFKISNNSLIQVMNDLNGEYKQTIKNLYINNNQTEFLIIYQSSEENLPSSGDDTGNSIITYYIDVSCQSLASGSEEGDYTNNVNGTGRPSDANGYIIYNPAKKCLSLFVGFYEGYKIINDCPSSEEPVSQPDIPIVISSGITIGSIYQSSVLEQILNDENVKTITDMIIETAGNYASGLDSRFFIIKYSMSSMFSEDENELICHVLRSQYSSTYNDGYSILISDREYNRAYINTYISMDEREYHYSIKDN